MIVKMNGFGHSLVSRAAGRVAYNRIVSLPTWGTEKTVFDFSGVGSITNSFADEVFGRMAFEMGMEAMRKKTSFKGINPFMARIVRTTIDARADQSELLKTTV